ncbi:MAG: helix-turn-helix domain-containing protein [Bryobacterales bacterium]|nr:helix-turn-helix domain-containing protein [Bryobacterales bacterium]
MEPSPELYYQAYVSRDPRFDGVFYIGVTSTGIYCRPVCPARTPKASNCRFYGSAEAAEKDSFRPCLRCRPELAPGSAPVDDARRIAQLLMQRIGNGLIDSGAGLEVIAGQFELSSRQIRRIVQKELGVSPIELIQTRRLLLAKQLLAETALPVTEIAFASGFASLRRFNDAFQTRYGMAPSRLRKEAAEGGVIAAAYDTSVLQISYRPPYDWKGILNFLAKRTVKSVEWVTEESYARTVRLGQRTGWIRLTHAPGKNALMMEFTHSLTPVLPALMSRVRHLFDLNARPDVISAHLQKDSFLKDAVLRNPGLRVPGAFDGFELAARAILGQQVTVKAATTLACRLMEAYGDPIETPFAELSRLSPLPEKLAKLGVGEIARYGIVSARAKSVIALAQVCASAVLTLEPGVHPEKAVAQLDALPGIGPWTAHYIAMRALRWPDGFPKEDIAIRNNLGGVSAKEADAMSQAWRPWRSYAVLHIWNGL